MNRAGLCISLPGGTAIDSTIEQERRALPETARLFFALWPDEVVRDRLSLAGEKLHARCGGRRTFPATIHLTLVFLGNVELTRLAALQAAAGEVRFPAFELRLSRLGWWRHNRVAWAAPEWVPAELTKLVGELQGRLRDAGFVFDEKPYSPHITLLRKANCSGADFPGLAVDWKITEFVLVKSLNTANGAAYETIGRWHAS
jgi:2'-5' RNA ligase